MGDQEISLGHRLFDKTYPLIRFVYEKVRRQAWFSQITPSDGIPETLWLGGGPDYERDRRFLLEQGIQAVINIRAERADPIEFYEQHGIQHVQYPVPDISTPDPQTITQAADWIKQQAAAGRPVLVHCAKGRGRSATLLAGYLMREHALTYEQAVELLESRRPLTKLEQRHRQILQGWIRSQR